MFVFGGSACQRDAIHFKLLFYKSAVQKLRDIHCGGIKEGICSVRFPVLTMVTIECYSSGM
jgi:hypothetical protein